MSMMNKIVGTYQLYALFEHVYQLLVPNCFELIAKFNAEKAIPNLKKMFSFMFIHLYFVYLFIKAID